MRAKVYVSPKRAVLDPQGKVVESGLHSLGYSKVSDVRVGKYIEIELGQMSLNEADVLVDEMCRRFLSNPVIEDYQYELME
jgi:phosphoribosylformylglycinamidine synthase